ncbi:MAG: acyltransferase [Akkermansia sp.]|nr:acyltransferase [Akkermansia sp.]
MQIEYKTSISNQRTLLMGIAIILVMLYHIGTSDSCRFPFPLSDLFLWYGHWGVDIFLFLSGFGICYSLNKTKQQNTSFFLRRLRRIMPTCLLVGWLSIILFSSFSLNAETVAKALGLHEWYIRTIIIYYAISPILLWYLSKGNKTKKLFYIFSSSILLTWATLWIFSNNVWNICSSPLYTIYGSILFSTSRFPAFVFGFYVASADRNEAIFLQKKSYLFLAIISLCIALVGHGFSFPWRKLWPVESNIFSFIFVAFALPPLLYVLGTIASKIPRCMSRALIYCGTYSLEFFLLHSAIYVFVRKFCAPENYLVFTTVAFSLTFAAGFILNKTVQLLMKPFTSK